MRREGQHRDILASATASALDRQDHRRAPAWSTILLEVPEGEDGAEEDALLREGLRAAGCPRPQPFTLKQMTHLQLTSATFVHGGVAAISRADANVSGFHARHAKGGGVGAVHP